MADRPSQSYGMTPSNFSMLQQQAAQQQQQLQQQQADSHPGPGFPGLWQQQPMQQPFRPRSGAGIAPPQSQMNDLVRNQNMARVQGGQQMPFGMGVGVPNMAGQQPFHDPSSNQSGNGNMTNGGFALGGMMNSNMNPAMQQQQRNLLQGLPASNQRQLDMIIAHNQNNASMNFAKFTQQSQMPQRPDQSQQQSQQQPFLATGMNHSSPADIFSSPGMSNDAIRRGSPSHPNIMPSMPSNMPGQIPSNQQPQQRRPVTIPELNERATQLRLAIQNEENAIHGMNMQAQIRGGVLPSEIQQRFKQLTGAVSMKKDYLAKIVQSLAVQNPSGLVQQPSPGSAPGWGPQGPPFDNGSQRGNAPPMQFQSAQLPAGGPPQGGPSIVKPQTPVNHQAGLPQRSDQQATPHGSGQQQHMGQQGGLPGNGGGPFQVGPMNGQFQGMNGAGRTTPQASGGQNPMGGMNPQALQSLNIGQFLSGLSPLDRVRFEGAYKNFCMKRNFRFDPTSLQIENRQVDLWTLHRVVMLEGGFNKIEQNGSWDIVAGKIGFVTFVGSDGQPNKSGPGVALQIITYYKEYLQSFDSMYISSMLDARNKAADPNGPTIPNPAMIAFAITGTTPAGMPAQPPPNLASRNPQLMAQLLSYAHRTAAELRQMGVPDKTIQLVEANRAQLQRTHQDQLTFQGRVRDNVAANQSQQQHPPNGDGAQNGMGPPGQQAPAFAGTAGGQGVAGQMQDRRMLGHGGIPNSSQGNFMNGGLGPPLPQHQQAGQGQRMQGIMGGQQHPGQPAQGNFPVGTGRPSREQLQVALTFIARTKDEVMANTIPNMSANEVPSEQRVQYNHVLEQLYRHTAENDAKLPMYYVLLKNEDVMRKLIAIACTVAYQRNLVSSNSPRIVVSLETLKSMLNETVRINDHVQGILRNVQAQHATQAQQQQQQQQHFQQQQHQHQLQQLQQQIQQHQQQTSLNGMSPPGNHPQDHSRPPMTPSQHPPANIPHPPQPQQTTPHLASQQLRPSIPLNAPPPPRRNQKLPLTPGAMQSPSPAPITTASTPPNAPTPNAMVASPQAPKSPKTSKMPSKSKPAAARRRASKATAQSPAGGAPGSGNAAQTPQTHASPEAMSTPVQANASIKRQREDDPSLSNGGASPGPGMDGVANGPSPPKKMKMESLSEVIAAKKPDMSSEILHIKSEEDASQFLDQMTELVKYATNAGGQESLGGDISETLELLLKGCGSSEGGDGNAFGLPGGGPGNGRETPPPASLFDEYFDFSNMPDEEDSKVDTPELVSSSSTNLSPESNASDNDTAHHHLHQQQHHHQHTGMSASSVKMEPKLEDISDAVRLGPWKEIDGGEAAYYQSNEWKWEGSMTTVDHPWAIFNQ